MRRVACWFLLILAAGCIGVGAGAGIWWLYVIGGGLVPVAIMLMSFDYHKVAKAEEPEKKPTNRPKSLIAAAVLLFLLAVINLLGIAFLIAPGPYTEVIIVEIAANIIYFVLAVVGGIGLLIIKRWGWRFAMAAPIVGILKVLVDAGWVLTSYAEVVDGAVVAGWIIGIVLQAIILILLLRVRSFFSVSSHALA